MAYVTPSEVRLQFETNMTDEQLQALIDMACDYVNRYCRTVFEPVTVVDERYDGGESIIVPVIIPIISVESIKVYSPEGVEILEPDKDYFVYSSYIIHESVFPIGRRNISISYTAGYEEAPPIVKQIVIDLVKRASVDQGFKSETLGKYRYGLGEVKDILAPLDYSGLKQLRMGTI